MRGGRSRGIFDSGATPSATNVIDAIEITTQGNAIDFGDDLFAREEGHAAFASATRGYGRWSNSHFFLVLYILLYHQRW